MILYIAVSIQFIKTGLSGKQQKRRFAVFILLEVALFYFSLLLIELVFK